MSNVVIKKAVQAFNIDAHNRTAVCESDIDNGCIFELLSYSDKDGEDFVWEATAPTAATATGLWMATSPAIPLTVGYGDIVYKGLSKDPRAFTNKAGYMIDAIRLVKGDLIEMTGEGIDGIATNDYLVIDADEFTLKSATAATAGLSLKKVGVSKLAISEGKLAPTAIPTYKFEVAIN